MNLTFLKTERTSGWVKPFGGLAVLLIIVTLFLFWDSTKPAMTLFSNDGPLGSISSNAIKMPGTFFGYWHDLNWLGYEQPSASPGIYMALGLLLQNSVLYLKWCTPICLIILGLSAWFFFRTLGLRNLACTIGAIAAAFNMEVVSYACWGLPSRSLTFATTFLAGSFILRALKSRPWINLTIAGICVGLGLMEGYDIGALFSLYIAVFILFGFLIKPRERGEQPNIGRASCQGIAGIALVALAAGLASSSTISTLVGTQLQGSSNVQTENTQAAKEQQWNFLTQWSLPKMEALRIVVPGLYGYRLDTPRSYDSEKIISLEGGRYWGSMGQDPILEQINETEEIIAAFGQRNVLPGELAQVMNISVNQATQLMSRVQNKGRFLQRHSGSGEYVGIVVFLLAIWAILFALNKRASLYSGTERRMILFWGFIALSSLLLAFGKHSIFYQLIYQMPFFNTMRNTIKFLHPMHFALIILGAYGVEGLIRLAKLETKENSKLIRKWIIGSSIVASIILIFSLIFSSVKKLLAQHIASQGFSLEEALTMASFAGKELIITSIFLVISVFFIAKILKTKAATPFVIGLSLLVIADLTRANLPWIQYDDYKYKYENNTNPIINQLSQSSHEGRVTISRLSNRDLSGLYRIEWLQHQFLYNNIQSIDIVQAPRMSADHEAFERRFTITGDTNTHYLEGRRWELTNTRWILGGTNDVSIFNQKFDPGKGRFTSTNSFLIGLRSDIRNPSSPSYEDLTTQLQPNGPYCLIRFDGALPRAKLYSYWQVQTNNSVTLETLASREFDPHSTVIVNTQIKPSTATDNQVAGSVSIKEYKPKVIQLTANIISETVLMLNDHWSPHWKVSVDGEPAELLRCNSVMRGVHLEPGQKNIVFRFQPPATWLYVSLTSILTGFGLLGFIIIDNKKSRTK